MKAFRNFVRLVLKAETRTDLDALEALEKDLKAKGLLSSDVINKDKVLESKPRNRTK